MPLFFLPHRVHLDLSEHTEYLTSITMAEEVSAQHAASFCEAESRKQQNEQFYMFVIESVKYEPGSSVHRMR